MGRAELRGVLEREELKANPNVFPILILSLRGYGALASHLVQPWHAQMVHSLENCQIIQEPGEEMTIFKVNFNYMIYIFESSDHPGKIGYKPQFLPIAAFCS